MHLHVISPNQTLIQTDVEQVSLPSQIGEITVLPNHMPLITNMQPWLVKFLPTDPASYNQQTFTFDDKRITIAIGEGIAYIDGKTITVMTIDGATSSDKTANQRQTEKKELQKQYDALDPESDKDHQATIQKQIATIDAHLQLLKLQS